MISGVTYPFRALAVFRQKPELRGYVVIPILVNLAIGIAVYAGLLLQGFQRIDTLIANLPPWAAFLAFLLRFLLVIALFLGTGFVVLQFGVILGSPWYGKLSEELEQSRTGKLPPSPPLTLTSIFYDIWRAILFEVKKIVLTICLGIPLFALNFFPGVGTAIATTGGIALATVLVCLDFFDPALERRRLSFRAKIGIIFRSFPSSITFGLVSLGLISIPFINLLAIPLCVSGGTLFFCDRMLPKLKGK